MAPKKNWLVIHAEYALASALVFGLRTLPLPAATRLAFGAGRVLDLTIPKLRRTALRNLELALPELDAAARTRIAGGVFRSVGRLLLSLARFPALNAPKAAKFIRYEGLENYYHAKRDGHGVLVATAHLGNWELSAFAHAFLTEPMNVMVRPLDNPLIDRLVEERRTLSGNKLIYKKDGARAVLKALKQNEAVGILVDQNTALAEGVFVEFFGRAACANTGFVKLAYHARAPIIPGFLLWDEATNQYILRFYPAIELCGDAQIDTQMIHSQLEQVIREYPDQWMWIHRRWKTRPPGEAEIY